MPSDFLIDLPTVRDRWRACYDAERLAALYPVPRTPLEVLTLRDGPWASVPDKDRLWTVLRREVLPDKVLRLFAADCAERALLRRRAKGRELYARSWNAVEVARRHARGEATHEELAQARTAALDADAYAASAADDDAAYAASAAAAYAYAAADVTAAAAAADVTAAAAAAVERAAQVASLLRIIAEESNG